MQPDDSSNVTSSWSPVKHIQVTKLRNVKYRELWPIVVSRFILNRRNRNINIIKSRLFNFQILFKSSTFILYVSLYWGSACEIPETFSLTSASTATALDYQDPENLERGWRTTKRICTLSYNLFTPVVLTTILGRFEPSFNTKAATNNLWSNATDLIIVGKCNSVMGLRVKRTFSSLDDLI